MIQTSLFASADDGEIIDLPGADARYWARWVAQPEALASELVGVLNWQQRELMIYGRRVLTPRLVAWCGDPGVHYHYSGDTAPRQPWPGALQRLRQQLEAFCHHPFNGVLANYYRNGDDSMGWHSDDETSLGKQPVIASISLGAGRDFSFRPRGGGSTRHLHLENGSLLIMAGETQRHWQHALPRRRSTREPRLNLTFRHVKTPETP